MEALTQTIDVNVPIRQVYNQWTQFEEFPCFMEGVKAIKQLDDKRLHWEAEVGGQSKEWDAEIFEQEPDKRISWRRMNGAPNRGTVSFQSLDGTTTRVTLYLSYEPDGLIEKAGDALGIMSTVIEGDLKRFKEFIEAKGASTGWRGKIRGNKVDHPKNSGNEGTRGRPPSRRIGAQVDDSMEAVLKQIAEMDRIAQQASRMAEDARVVIAQIAGMKTDASSPGPSAGAKESAAP